MSRCNSYRTDLIEHGAVVVEIDRDAEIYEDRLRHAARLVAGHRPRAVLATLSPESFEVLRQMPDGVVRIGVLQADEPEVYRLVSVYAPWLDVVVGVSERICAVAGSLPEAAGLRIEHIPYGVRFFRESPLRHATREGPLRVAYVGRLDEPQKRISRIAEVVRRCGDPRFAFTIVGSGPMEGSFRAELSGCANVEFAGEVTPMRVQEILAEQDVLLLLSDYEGLPLALLEGMGMGCVPVVSDLESGIRDLVGSTRGIRVPVGDVDSAEGALRSLEADRARAVELGEAAAHFVRSRHGAVEMAARYRALADGATGCGPGAWRFRAGVPTPLWVQPSWRYRGPVRVLRRWLRTLRMTRPGD